MEQPVSPFAINGSDWLRALELAAARAAGDVERQGRVISDAVADGDQPRVLQLLATYLRLTQPDPGLVAAVRERFEFDVFSAIVSSLER